MTDPERHESLSPTTTEADQRHTDAYLEMAHALHAPIMNELELGIAIARLLESTVQPANDDYTDIRDQIELWKTKYQYDRFSTYHGDRTSDSVTINADGEEESDDVDGSGLHSINKKRAGLVYETALYVVTSPDSVLSMRARGTIIRSAISLTSKYANIKAGYVRKEFETDMLASANAYYGAEDLDHVMLVLGAAISGGAIVESQEFAFLRDAPNPQIKQE